MRTRVLRAVSRTTSVTHVHAANAGAARSFAGTNAHKRLAIPVVAIDGLLTGSPLQRFSG